MCGIGGWLGPLPGGDAVAQRMLAALRHRGPDGEGVQAFPDATLVHTRLSILDLSAAGSQPMGNEDGTVWVVFNGEIYNHHDLRADLEQRGHAFHGRSDGEVLPHLYEEHGSGMVERLRGMFAFALYDARARALLLARDRFGIKPLFYAPGPERLAFASELRALREAPGWDRSPDPQAVHDYTALLYVPAPATFHRGARAVEPGHLVEAQCGPRGLAWKTRPYHAWAIAPDPTLELPDAAARADALLTTAVERQLESDVPMGALLSGGIDSSLVSTAAQAALPRGLRTFNVKFPEEAYDETWAALAVARHIGSHHETLDIGDVAGAWDHVAGLLGHAGQPFADTSLFATHAVCRRMRREVTVALSGDGGDEAFGGYRTYVQLAKVARLRSLPGPLRGLATGGLAGAAAVGVLPSRIVRRARELARADDVAVVQTFFSWVREEEHAGLVGDDGQLPVRRLFERQWAHRLPPGSGALERLSALMTEVNLRLALPNDYLFKVDTASMRESLEVRVPLLDEDLVAFGLTLPHRLKADGRQGKRVLREVARRRLPRDVAEKPKMGFGIPVDTWVDAGFKSRFAEELLASGSPLAKILEPEGYRPLVEAFAAGRTLPQVSREGLYQRAIMLLAMHLALAEEPRVLHPEVSA